MKKMKFVTGVVFLLGTLSLHANTIDQYQLEDLKMEALRETQEFLLDQDLELQNKGCRSVTRCTTDFNGNTTCSVELVCDL